MAISEALSQRDQQTDGPGPAVPTDASEGRVAHRVPTRVKVTLGIAGALVLAFLVSLIVRSTGSYYMPVDGWGVAAFEITMGNLCLARYFEGSWRTSRPEARLFPLVMGVACIAWGLGDMALTAESIGGATPSVPSVADGFYVCFFPLCFLAFALLVRRGNRSSLVATGMAAGMDDFITKPVRPEAVGTALERWVTKRATRATSNGEPLPAPARDSMVAP
jgi:hypothetical protein